VNPSSPFAWSIYAIVGLSLLGLPVGHAMIGGSILYLYLAGLDMGTAAEQLLNGMYSSFLLLAIPLFVLAAEFMNAGSIMDRLLRFCNAIVGRFRGGMAHVNVVQSIIFASMSGSALADAASSGKLMQSLMTRDGRYPPAYAAALTTVSSVIGPIIPPSIPLVLFALVSDTSVGYLFLGGVIPGLLLGVMQMMLIALTAKRRHFPVEEKVPLRELPRVTWQAFPALMMPVILLGCLYSGVTTPTEAAAVAAAYALLVSALLYRSVSLRDVYQSLCHERAHHRVDRHADRRRAGVQLRDHVGEHPQHAERDADGLRCRRSRSCLRQRAAAGARLLSRRARRSSS
jgi:tripartite ATP-independent transporter DctM subunit